MKFVFFSFLLVTSACFGQVELVELGKPCGSTYDYSQTEPSIAIDPNDPSIMAAGTILSDYYYSKDGGKTWKSKTLKSSYGVYGDPVLTVSYTHLRAHETRGNLVCRLLLEKKKK